MCRESNQMSWKYLLQPEFSDWFYSFVMAFSGVYHRLLSSCSTGIFNLLFLILENFILLSRGLSSFFSLAFSCYNISCRCALEGEWWGKELQNKSRILSQGMRRNGVKSKTFWSSCLGIVVPRDILQEELLQRYSCKYFSLGCSSWTFPVQFELGGKHIFYKLYCAAFGNCLSSQVDHTQVRSSCMRSEVLFLNGDLHTLDFERFHSRENKRSSKLAFFK